MKDTIALQIGLDVIRSYKRLAYTPWHALAEFIDNSTQSYRNNERALEKAYAAEGKMLEVSIQYDRTAGVLVVRDNAMGMALSELKSALHIGSPPSNTSGRSQFGLGLKTAACWFGDKWSIVTKKLGATTGYKVDVDVDKVASSASKQIPFKKFKAPTEAHYTEIRIEKLHQSLQGRRLGKTKESLVSMYRVDIREKKLQLSWGNAAMPWFDDYEFLKLSDGTYREQVRFSVGGRAIRGWVGVLAPGSSGRSSAGFALIRKGRLIRGWPEAWRPEAVFGPWPGRNDLINQRVTGELHLDDFDVTHTKDDICWRGNEEDDVQDSLKRKITDALAIAREFRHVAPPASDPPSAKLAVQTILQDSDLGSRIAAAARAMRKLIEQLPRAKALAIASSAIFQQVAADDVVLPLVFGQREEGSLRASDRSGSDAPYMVIQLDEIVFVVNALHPAYRTGESDGELRTHLEHSVADALVSWAASQSSVALAEPNGRLWLKDAVLRLLINGGA
jgi:hypothetical protein